MRVAFGAALGIVCSVAQPAWPNGGAARRGDVPLQTRVAGLIGGGVQRGAELAPSFRLRIDAGAVASTRQPGETGEHLRRRFTNSMVDYYPFGDGFHLSTGGRLDNRAKATRGAVSDMRYLLYTPKSLGTRRTGIKRFSPAMTAGYAATLDDGVTLGLEAGALVERNDPAIREFNRFAHQGTRGGGRFDSNSRVNPVVQLAFGYKF